MRDYLFRGKHKKSGAWAYGYLDSFSESPKARIICVTEKGTPFTVTVVPETIGQFTGLLDKNGARIFEGDIVKADLDFQPDERVGLIGEIVFKKGAFMLSQTHRNPDLIDYYTSWLGDYHNIEEIGNKYDNPELLRQTNAPSN